MHGRAVPRGHASRRARCAAARRRRGSSTCSRPSASVDRLDAVVLTGGSAFGLAAADGVMRWCAERGSGSRPAPGRCRSSSRWRSFDLLVGDGSRAARARPRATPRALTRRRRSGRRSGAVGAGTGATVGKWRGREHARPGGLGSATVARRRPRRARARRGERLRRHRRRQRAATGRRRRSTCFGADSARGREHHDRRGRDQRGARQGGCLLVAQGGHDGMARALIARRTRAATATRRRRRHRAGRGGRRPRPLPRGARRRASDPVGRRRPGTPDRRSP